MTDVERVIDQLLNERGTGEIRRDAMRKLARWVYLDAIAVCKAQIIDRPSDHVANYFDGACRTCATKIGERSLEVPW